MEVLGKQGARTPEIKKAPVETDASKCVQPWRLWQGLTRRPVGRTAVGAMIATAIVTAETTTATTMMTAAAATIAVVETTFATLARMLGTALVLPLPFRTGAKLRTAVFATIVAAVATATTTAAIILAPTVSTAIATFIATTVAGAFVLTWSGNSWSLLRGVTAKKTS